MKVAPWLIVPVAGAFLIGCTGGPTEKHQAHATNTKASNTSGKPANQTDDETEIKAALAQLDLADRELAEAQKFCAVMNDSRLGSMGKPFKVMVKDEPVLLCCKSCQKKALADPDKTLAKVKELKAKSGSSPEK
jgi:hypothetical protein